MTLLVVLLLPDTLPEELDEEDELAEKDKLPEELLDDEILPVSDPLPDDDKVSLVVIVGVLLIGIADGLAL